MEKQSTFRGKYLIGRTGTDGVGSTFEIQPKDIPKRGITLLSRGDVDQVLALIALAKVSTSTVTGHFTENYFVLIEGTSFYLSRRSGCQIDSQVSYVALEVYAEEVAQELITMLNKSKEYLD